MSRIAFLTIALVLTAAVSGEAKAAPQPFLDCGLARYDDSLPAQVVRSLREMASKLGELPPVERDVTDIAYAEGVLGAVPDCLDPNVRFLASNDGVAIELRGLAHNVCRSLIGSLALHAAGATVDVRDVRTNEPIASCGLHPILELLRMGPNVVVVTIPRQRPDPSELITLGRSLARKNFETLFDLLFEPSTLIERTVAFGVDFQQPLLKSSRRLTLKDGTKIGYLSPTEVPEAERDNKAAYKVIKALVADDARQQGWSTNCHGVAFLAGALWLNDANTIFERALEVPSDSVRPGDFVLWRDSDGLIIHSATIVSVGASADKILLYQDAGGMLEHIVSLQDHVDGNAYGSDRDSDWFFARIRSGWPNSR